MQPVKSTLAKIGAGVLFAGTATGGTFALDASINPYTTAGNSLKIIASSTLPEAGTETVILDTTQPKITLSKWSGEVQLGITSLDIPSDTTGARIFLSKNVGWNAPSISMEAVPIDPTISMEDGGMEININLASKPASNVFTFKLEGWENLDFFYQPPLKNTNPDGSTWEPDGNGIAQSPANITGSYAVYYRKNGHVLGKTNYATGKAFQIFRPLAIDKNGVITWADLNYSNGILTVTVPQIFLDTSTYPVTVDPTLGYTSVGALNTNGYNNFVQEMARGGTDANGGNMTKIQMAAWINPASGNVKMAAYTSKGLAYPGSDYGDVLVTNSSCTVAVTQTAAPTQDSEWTSCTTVTGTLAASTNYWVFSDNDTAGINIAYDNAANGTSINYNLAYSSFPPATGSGSGSNSSRAYSEYLTYAAAAATTVSVPRLEIETPVILQAPMQVQ